MLKCTCTYHTTPQNTNLRTIPHLQQLFPDTLVGLSDHTMGVGVAVAAVALGACVVEKHVTLRRADGGVDSAFSLEPEEVAQLVTETERAWQALGHVQYGVQRAEEKSRLFKRSIYVARDIAFGEPFTAENIRVVRPGDGLAPRYYEQVLGRTARHDLKAGTPLTWEVL
jgi:sialic acid synthase SpsE